MGTASFIFQMKVLKASVTVSCLNVNFPYCTDTLPAPKICVVIQTSLLYKVLMASVVILQVLWLVHNGSVSYVEGIQKEIRLADIALKESQETFC